MTGKTTSILIMRLQLINGKKAAFGESRINSRSGMPFTEDKPIPVLHLGGTAVDMKYFCIQYPHDVRHG